jgi:diguanylate cyclase (GGDEF)-like protein
MMLSEFLKDLGHQVEQANSGIQALEMLGSGNFDLMLLDVNMPGLSGEDVLRELSRTPMFHQLPVIVVSGATGIEVVVRCIQSGAEDFVTKPFEKTLLRTRVETLLEKKRLRDIEAQRTKELEGLKAELELKNQALEENNRVLERMAFTDTLTEVPNRRFAMDTLQRLYDLFMRNQRMFSLILLDVDHFKQVNDRYGHECGDKVLVEVAKLGRKACRDCDVFCRFGGEEFIVICPESDLTGAAIVAERLREQLSKLTIPFDQHQLTVTASFGIAAVHVDYNRLQGMIAGADEALYEAKRSGRNRVAVSNPPAATGVESAPSN